MNRTSPLSRPVEEKEPTAQPGHPAARMLGIRSTLMGLWLMAMMLSAVVPMGWNPSGHSFLHSMNRLLPLVLFQALGFACALGAAVLSFIYRRWLSGFQVLYGVAPLSVQVLFWGLVFLLLLGRIPG